MAKNKKPPVTDMKEIAGLKSATPGALPAAAAPFDTDKESESPTEQLEIDDEDVGIDDADSEFHIEENEDGSATVSGKDKEIEGAKDFDANLAEVLPSDVLDTLAERYLQLIDQDEEARKERDKQQADGFRRAGLGGPAPGGADFEGASRVTHPVLSKSYVDFSAASIKELFPPSGPVRTHITGKITDEKIDKANRKRDFMNFQLTKEIPEYRDELEILLTQLPAGGSQFMKVYWSKAMGRATVEFVPIDEFILPYNAKSYKKAQRKFHRLHRAQWEYDRDVAAGMYVDVEARPNPPGSMMDQTKSSQQADKIEGKDSGEVMEDSEYTFYEGGVLENSFDDPLRPEDREAPYIITIDSGSRKILSLYRNWDEKDEKCEELQYIVKFGFIPWRGAYDIGLPHLIGDLSAAMTGALRALLDSAHIQNSATAMKLKGRPGGETVSINPTQVGEIDALGQDDIRKVMMPIQFNGPSPVLLQLLGYLTTAAEGVVTTSEEKIADAGGNMPVGTTIALIEQGAKTYSSIHARLHHSQAECMEILHRINRDHLPSKTKYGSDDEDVISNKDFDGPMDIQPVSDPNIFSETQRFAQIQAVISLKTQFPGALNDGKILTRMLQLMKLPDYKDLLNTPPDPKPTHPVSENVMMAMGKPTMAFPEQDHLAHLQVHLDFLQNPMFGSNPMIAKTFIPAVLEHVKQHMLFYYADLMRLQGREELGEPIEERARKDKTWQSDRDISEALAKASPITFKAIEHTMSGIPPVLQKAQELMQKLMTPPPPADPQSMVAMKELEQRAQEHQADSQLAEKRLELQGQKQQTDAQIKAANQQAAATKTQAQQSLTQTNAELEAQTEIQVQTMKDETEIDKTARNNATALDIAAMEGRNSHLTDGGSMGEK
jgi:hypothetical protein